MTRMTGVTKRTSIFLAIGLVLGLVGFGTGSKIKAQQAAPTAVQGVRYSMNVVVSSVPFWRDTRRAWEVIGKQTPGVNTEFGGPTGTDAQRQIDEIEALLAKGTQGLIVAPADSAALAPVINKAHEKGVPVITYLVDAPSSKRLAYVASELETASMRVAESLTGNAPQPGKAIIVFAQSGNEEQEARRRGFEQFVARYPQLQIVGVVQDNYDEAKGAEQIRALLSRHPDLKYIFGANSRSAVGATSALREFGAKAGQVQVTGWDTDKDVLDLIKQGWVQRTVAQQSTYMTILMFSILEASRKGYLYPADRSFKENGVRPVPDKIVVPVAVVTPENVAAFYPKD